MTALYVNSITKPGNWPDGDSLYLRVRPDASKSWAFRYKLAGKQHWLSLGPVRDVPLAEAREASRKMRNLLRDGYDPLKERLARKAQILNEAGKTFDAVAKLCIEERSESWGNTKHRAQWQSTLDTYASPVIGNLPLASIGLDEILRILRPIWKTKTETASRVRGRIEAVIDYGTIQGWRKGDNPARWSGHLDQILPPKEKVKPVEHHPAVPWLEIGPVMAKLAKSESSSSKALRFIILTAARSDEVRSARWREIDLKDEVWTVPATRMKGKREHRVPLCPDAIAILKEIAPSEIDPEKLVFKGGKAGSPLSDVAVSDALKTVITGFTVHGMRSTFRDWAGEHTEFPRELAEAALAHGIKDKAEAAYARGTAVDRRRILMTAWADWCFGRTDRPGNKVQLLKT